jgi:hypothetical protein
MEPAYLSERLGMMFEMTWYYIYPQKIISLGEKSSFLFIREILCELFYVSLSDFPVLILYSRVLSE